RHLRTGMPATARAADGGNHPLARSRAGRRAAGVRAEAGGHVTYEGVPGVVETKDAHGETTLVVDPARLVEACMHLRDEDGFDFLSDVTATDYLGWGSAGP